MSDQLSLDLEAGLPSLPAALRPMVARPLPTPFDSPDHLFEPTWAGERVLAFVEGGSLRLCDASGTDLAALVPELASLPERVMARSGVLDGELVVVDALGRSDPGALRNRLAGREGPPVAYLVFDLPYVDGRPLLGTPLARRRELLARTLTPGDQVVAVPAIAGEGLALHAAVSAQGIAGMLARVRTSPYLPGIRSRLWRFVPAGEGVPAAGQAEEPLGAAGGATSPVVALIRRLPLDED